MKHILLIAAAVATLAAPLGAQRGRGGGDGGQAPPIQNPASTGSAAGGKPLYQAYSCWACHGYNAQTGNGQRLLPPRLNEMQFVAYIRAPRTQGMPAYSQKVLTDAQVADIYAYILSLPREPQARDVPLLQQLPQ